MVFIQKSRSSTKDTEKNYTNAFVFLSISMGVLLGAIGINICNKYF